MSDAVVKALREAGEAARLSLGADGGCLQIACANCTLPPCACADAAAAAAVVAFHRRMAEHWKGFAPDWQARHTQMADSVERAAQEDKR
jgi:hypothetical protein